MRSTRGGRHMLTALRTGCYVADVGRLLRFPPLRLHLPAGLTARWPSAWSTACSLLFYNGCCWTTPRSASEHDLRVFAVLRTRLDGRPVSRKARAGAAGAGGRTYLGGPCRPTACTVLLGLRLAAPLPTRYVVPPAGDVRCPPDDGLYAMTFGGADGAGGAPCSGRIDAAALGAAAAD